MARKKETGLMGLRLKFFSGFDCYLNTALNNVVCNPVLLEGILKDEPLRTWAKDVLVGHHEEFGETDVPADYMALLGELGKFMENSVGCTNAHGALCFISRKKEIKNHLANVEILREIREILAKGVVVK